MFECETRPGVFSACVSVWPMAASASILATPVPSGRWQSSFERKEIMEINTAAGSTIAIMTLDRTMGGGRQSHKIRWVPLPNCPDGYIVQRITRDTKTTWGEEVCNPNTNIPIGKIAWAKPAIVRADYYELWEVCGSRIFPSKSEGIGGGTYHSHAGVKIKDWFGDRYKDPADYNGVQHVVPADVYHDVFTDTVPACRALQHVKGTNKILGKVYFFPRDGRPQPEFLRYYLTVGLRNREFHGFTGGILLQLAAQGVREPDKRYLQITRYEAIGFDGSYRDKRIYDRKFPGIMRKSGQGVVNASNVNFTYGAGTYVGPAGRAVADAVEE